MGSSTNNISNLLRNSSQLLLSSGGMHTSAESRRQTIAEMISQIRYATNTYTNCEAYLPTLIISSLPM